jgi:uncharacterized protein YndB with AHSA1/START domain
MKADRIEREIEIDAPIEVVWSVITEPQHMMIWFNDQTELDLRPGGAGRFTWETKARTRPTIVNVQVDRVEEPTFFSFLWNFPDGAEPGPANAPRVEFSLEALGDKTIVRLVESGITGIPESETYYAEHSSGWGVIASRLLDYANAQGSRVG